MKILIVDSNTKESADTQKYLSSLGHEVETAKDGWQGLKRFYFFSPQVSIIDVDAPDIDGLTMIQAIRRRDNDSTLVLCADRHDEVLVIKALRAGASDYLHKPISTEALDDLFNRLKKKAVGASSDDVAIGASILLVDDEPNILKSLSRDLGADGHKILTASSAKEGLELLEGNNVALVISDWKMPGLDGVEFLKKVLVRSPETLTIMLTAHPQLERPMDAINQAGVFKFMLKPWDSSELRYTVMRTLEFRRSYLIRDALKRGVKREMTMFKSLED